MSEGTAETAEQGLGKIIGETIVGQIDPRSLTQSQFEASDNLLFHGGGVEFTYSSSGDFDSSLSADNNAADFGAGFYTTDNKQQAINYSKVRSRITRQTPVVYSFLPFKAKLLDVRDSTDPGYNGALPKEFVEKWITYLENYLKDDKNFQHYNGFQKEVVQQGISTQFLERLRLDLQQNKIIKIRGDNLHPGIFNTHNNGLIDTQFRDFMLEQGYDGMIYREKGEGEHGEPLTGYVFYNYQSVDTWSGWQKRTPTQ